MLKCRELSRHVENLPTFQKQLLKSCEQNFGSERSISKLAELSKPYSFRLNFERFPPKPLVNFSLKKFVKNLPLNLTRQRTEISTAKKGPARPISA